MSSNPTNRRSWGNPQFSALNLGIGTCYDKAPLPSCSESSAVEPGSNGKCQINRNPMVSALKKPYHSRAPELRLKSDGTSRF